MKTLFALLMTSLVCQAATPGTLARVGMIQPRFQEMVDRGEIPGAVYLVAVKGELLALKAVGWQNIDEKKPMRTDSVFQIMSMTKPITAAALMMLVEEGKVVLTDPVEKYLPEFAKQPLAAGSIAPKKMTVYQLLTHTNGMTDPPAERRKEIQYDLALTLADAVKYYASQPPSFEPGARWGYSNTGIATAGRIVEVVAGVPFENFIEQRILKPLGMKDSFFFPDAARIPRIAMLYRRENGKFVNPGPNVLGGDPAKYRQGAKYSAPEYGLYSTASDVAAFYQMMLDGGTYNAKRLLSRSTVEVMTTLHTGNLTTFNLGAGNGLGFTVPRDPDATYDLVPLASFGHGGAFGTWSFADKNKGLVGVMLIQLTGPGNNTAQKVFNAMVESAIDR